MNGTWGRPLTTSGTMRPAAFETSSDLSKVGINTPQKRYGCAQFEILLDQSHGSGPLHQLQGAMDHGRIDHLRAKAYDAQTLLLRVIIGGNDLAGAIQFGRGRREGLVDHCNLHRVDTSHAFEAESAGVQTPGPQAIEITDVTEYRIDCLDPGGVGHVDDALAGIVRFSSDRGLHDAEVGGVIFEPDRNGSDLLAGFRDGKSVLDSQCRLQYWHQPDRPCQPIIRLNFVNSAADFEYLFRRLDLRNQNKVRTFRDDLGEVLNSQWKLVDADHPLALEEVDRAQSVSHEQS